MKFYIKIMGNKKFYRFHSWLHCLSSRAMGIGNHESPLTGEYFFLEKILPRKKDMVIFDVGAFHGEYSSFIKKILPQSQIYAFEPDKNSYPVLENKGKELDIKTFSFALGSQEEERPLYYPFFSPNTGSAVSSLYPRCFDQLHHCGTNSHSVRISTLDKFCQDFNITFIDLLKIDTEGFEFEVLKGASSLLSSLRIDIIQFELNEHVILHRKLLCDFMDLLPFHTFYRLLPKGILPLSRKFIPEVIGLQNIIASQESLD